MKIFLLKPIDEDSGPWDPWYDKAFGFVVRAEDEVRARQLAAKAAGDEAPRYSNGSRRQSEKNPWRDEQLTLCEVIGESKQEGVAEVILRDFRSA